MAKYEVTHKCGHTVTVNLLGKTADRERRIEWIKTQECPKCRKAAHAAEMAGKAESAKEAANEFGLPELRGSEKQVNWALDIRRGVMDKLAEEIKAMAREDEESIAIFTKWVKVFGKDTINNADAKFWIDERYNFRLAEDIFENATKAAKKYFAEYFEAHGIGREGMTRAKMAELTNEMTA